MPNRVDTTGEHTGLDEKALLVLGRLAARALEGGSLGGANELELEECAEPLEALAWPAQDTMERLELWLGPDYGMAKRRARRLRDALEASATVTVCGDPAQAAPTLGALQRFAYYLAERVEARPEERIAHALQDRDGPLEALRLRLEASPPGQGGALVLVHCGAVDKIDALRGLRAGEALVAQIADALRRQVLRPSDSLEPVSRDEFACLLQPIPSEGVSILAAQKMLQVLDAPIEIEDFAVPAEPNVGIAMFPEHGKDAEELLQHAKAALRNARSGRERIATYRAGAPETEFDESRYAARLRHAIQNNGLQLFYQAQSDFRTGRIVGAEALLRWNDEVLGAVAPNIAVSVAESAGLMNELTLWVVSSAIQQCAAFRRLQPEFTVSVNISPSNLHEADLPAYVGRALRTWDVSPKGLIFEITETAILSDQKLALQALDELKRLGVGIAIDDFGTGYSSMYYLAQMPLDELKIDLMFVRQMLQLPSHAKIVRSLIDLAHNLELSVVAEGVEDEPIWSALQHLGCERAQGWFVGKPVPAAELAARIGDGASQLPPRAAA